MPRFCRAARPNWPAPMDGLALFRTATFESDSLMVMEADGFNPLNRRALHRLFRAGRYRWRGNHRRGVGAERCRRCQRHRGGLPLPPRHRHRTGPHRAAWAPRWRPSPAARAWRMSPMARGPKMRWKSPGAWRRWRTLLLDSRSALATSSACASAAALAAIVDGERPRPHPHHQQQAAADRDIADENVELQRRAPPASAIVPIIMQQRRPPTMVRPNSITAPWRV